MKKEAIQQAAKEARISSAETLTTFGLQSSIDDVVSISGKSISYDEVAESAFEKGAEWVMAQPLVDRLTEDEVKMIKAIYNRQVYSTEDAAKKFTEECLLSAVFGEEMF